MSKFISQLISLNENYELHLVRILILLYVISGKNRDKISGITKLVKLDFLLRYPTILQEFLLTKKNLQIEIYEYEKDNIESKMIRFKYGPWDHRYRLFLALLEAKNLINTNIHKKTTEIMLTEKGYDVSSKLLNNEEFQIYFERSKIIKTYFSSYSGTTIANMIYEMIPKLRFLKYGELITTK